MIPHDIDRRDPDRPAPLGAFYRGLRDDPRFADSLVGSSIVLRPPPNPDDKEASS